MKGTATPTRIYFPDYLTDSTRRRAVKVGRRLGGGTGLIPRFLVATNHEPLAWITLPLGPGPLYSREANDQAHAAAAALLTDAPAWCALQRGVQGNRHLNVLTLKAAVPPRRDLPWGTHVQDVTELVGLVRYLSGPPDACANRGNKDPKTGIYSVTTPEQHAVALEEYIAARALGRLPRMQWTMNVPLLKITRQQLEELEHGGLAQAAD